MRSHVPLSLVSLQFSCNAWGSVVVSVEEQTTFSGSTKCWRTNGNGKALTHKVDGQNEKGFTHEVEDQNGFEMNYPGADEGESGTKVFKYEGTKEDMRW